jgi:hypothetical protein
MLMMILRRPHRIFVLVLPGKWYPPERSLRVLVRLYACAIARVGGSGSNHNVVSRPVKLVASDK